MAKNIYTGNVASVTEFEDSFSIMIALHTRNGKPMKTRFVSKSWPKTNEIASNLSQGDEVAVKADGFSKEPVRFIDKAKTKPVYAVSGLDKKSLTTILPTELDEGEEETDEKVVAKTQGAVTRAREFMANLLKAAAGV